ncbi:MAG TPA: choice-of-anchor Q domain-containing protein [Myxococcota bacterium]
MSLTEIRLRSVVVIVTLLIAIAAVPAERARAAVFQAGPNAVPPRSIQAAIDAAIAAGGDNEVRIQGGTHAVGSAITVPASFASGSLHISGGWNASFTDDDGEPTLLVGQGTDRVFALRPSGGTVKIEDLSISGGVANGPGGGVLVEATGDSRVELRRLVINDNEAVSLGGGLYVHLEDEAVFSLENGLVRGNLVTHPSSSASGGGIHLHAVDDARFTISGIEIRVNTAASEANQATGGGIYVSWCGGASGAITDNLVEENEVASTSQVGSNAALWQSSLCGAEASGSVEIRRNRWLGGIGATTEQVSLISAGTGTVWFTDSLVAGGAMGGLLLFAWDTSTVHVTNVTIADHPAYGIAGSCDPGATLTFSNSIVFGNGDDGAPSCALAQSNLLGSDPEFAGPDDYTPGAPAIDQGTAAPPGGLGPSDLWGNPRTIGAAPDLGAIEVPEPGAAAGAVAALVALAACAARPRRRRR